MFYIETFRDMEKINEYTPLELKVVKPDEPKKVLKHFVRKISLNETFLCMFCVQLELIHQSAMWDQMHKLKREVLYT